MKPHTRHVLDACTGLLVDAAMTRKRRGVGVWQLNQEIWGGVALQHQDYADGAVKIYACPQVYWVPVQQIYALGVGKTYRAFQDLTRSRIWSFANLGEPDLLFEPDVPPAAELSRLDRLLHEGVIPMVRALADEESILEFYREEVPMGGHRPEMFLAISAWTSGSIVLDKEVDWVVSSLSDQPFIDGVTGFYDRLRSSPEVSALLRRKHGDLGIA